MALESEAAFAIWREEELDFFLPIVLGRRVGGGIEGRRKFGDTGRLPRERDDDDEGGLAPEQQADVQQGAQDRVDEGGGWGVELLDEEGGLADDVGWEGA